MKKCSIQEGEDDPLTQALERHGEGSKLLWMVFFFTFFPTIFSGMHSNTYIFIAEVPTHWCSIPELVQANWTSEQIRNLSSANSCQKYDYNYTLLGKMDFEAAQRYVRNQPRPSVSSCSEFHFEDDVDRYSSVVEWNLVCDRETNRIYLHQALSIGKLLGAAFLGVLADKYGRKIVYAFGIWLFVISGPVSAYIPYYWGFVALRLLAGMSFSAFQFSSLTILTELAGNKHRQWMGIAFNCGFATGSIFVAGICYLSTAWRQAQVATTLPAMIMVVFSWYMPESPRWLIAQGRRLEARRILERFNPQKIPDDEPPSNKQNMISSTDFMPDAIIGNCIANASPRGSTTSMHEEQQIPSKNGRPFSDHFKGLQIIFGSSELAIRACICYFAWMNASLTYYALALNVDNFGVNYYVYTVFMGLTEIPAYLVPTPMLMVMGRRKASSLLFFVSGFTLLSILNIPRSATLSIIVASLFGRFALSAAYGIFILYTSELFPTITRNSALGMSSTMAHIGTIVAPLSVVDLGILAWWAPSTLCGSLSIFAGFLCLILPETRGRPLASNVKEELAAGRELVSFRNCCCCFNCC